MSVYVVNIHPKSKKNYLLLFQTREDIDIVHNESNLKG